MARTRRTTTQDPTLVGLLDAARADTETLAQVEAHRFELAAAWAEAHPAPVEELEGELVDASGALIMYGDRPLTIAGEGAPQMAEFAVDEFARACGLSTYAGRALIGAAVEAKHRLPKIWAKAIAGEVAVWRVRKVTERTHRLTMAGAAHVDDALWQVVGHCSYAQVEKAVDAAEAETDPGYAEDSRLSESDAPYVAVELDQARRYSGRVPIHGLLDYPTAVAFEQALQAKAAALRDPDSPLSLDERRALALGQLGGGDQPSTEVVVYAHYQPSEARNGMGVVDVEQVGPTTLDQLYAWCRTQATQVTLRPVIDLDTDITCPGYRPSPELREQVILTLPTCVFPGCSRRARTCDLDHITPYNPRDPAGGGQTTSWNLAPLCRLHHRMKTHGHWTYQRLSKTSFEWTSPTGHVEHSDLTFKRRRTR